MVNYFQLNAAGTKKKNLHQEHFLKLNKVIECLSTLKLKVPVQKAHVASTKITIGGQGLKYENIFFEFNWRVTPHLDLSKKKIK